MKFSVEISIRNEKKISVDTFTIDNNKINFLFGESGIGKTLISKAILGLIREDDIDVAINGESYDEYKRNIGVSDMFAKSFYVFQEPSAHLSPTQTVAEQLKEGKLKNSENRKKILTGLFPNSDEKELNELLKIFPKPFRPSGGEKQRFLNAMAFIAMDKLNFSNAWNALFVFDEPTSHLDEKLRNVLLDELIGLYLKDKPTILFITHDYSLISHIEKRYKTLEDKFSFYEVFRDEEKLFQHFFEPEDYLSWLKELRKFSDFSRGGKVILKAESGIKVFGKTLNFYANTDKKRKTSLKVKKGSLVYLKAPSGTGKTTLAKILLGIIPSEFSAEIDGVKINSETDNLFFRENIWKKKLTMAFQHADESLNPNATVKDTFDSLSVNDYAELENLFFSLFGERIEKFGSKKIKHLSGGQKQKINILRSLALNSSVTILDEPLNGMDFLSARKVMEILKKQTEKGKTFLIISHNEDIFDRIATKRYILAAE